MQAVFDFHSTFFDDHGSSTDHALLLYSEIDHLHVNFLGILMYFLFIF